MRSVTTLAYPRSSQMIVQAVFGLMLVTLVAHAAPPAKEMDPARGYRLEITAFGSAWPQEIGSQDSIASSAEVGQGRSTPAFHPRTPPVWKPALRDSSGPDLELGGENEPAIAVNPTNPLNVAVATIGRLRVSTDGGQTFGPVVVPIYPGTYVVQGDPVLIFDRWGRLFWSYFGGIPVGRPYQGFLGNDIFIAQCDPQTGAILPGYPVDVTLQAGFAAADGYFNDKEWLAVDGSPSSPFADRLYIGWSLPLGGHATLISHSSDQGETWSAGIMPGGPPQVYAFPVDVATAPNGDVYFAEHRQPGFIGQNPDGVSGYVEVFRSTDGGETFPQQSQACSPGQADITWNYQVASGKIPGALFTTNGSSQPWVLPDPLVPGRVHVVVCDDPDNDVNAGDPSDIFIMTSSDYGQTWAAPRRVDAGPPGTFQLMPAPAIDPASGKIVLHYYDNRAGLLNEGGNYLLDVFATSSTDGGQTFDADAPINDQAFDPDAGSPCYTSCGKNIYDVWVAGDSSAFAVGPSTTVLRFDGGSWWVESVGSQSHNGVWGHAENDVFVVGRNGSIYHYDGSSWASQTSGTTQVLYAVHGRSGTDVLAVGAGGAIQHYSGAAWSSMVSGTTEDLLSVWMSPSGRAYAGSVGGSLLVFDGTWSTLSLTSEPIAGLWGTTDNNIWAVGWRGTIFHFDGTTWTSRSSGLPYLSGIWGSSESDVYAVGLDVAHFDGHNWAVSSFAEGFLTKVYGSSQSNVVAVGVGGRIGRFDGTRWATESSPWSPVNPTTRIGEYNGMAIGGGRQYAVWCGNTYDQAMNPVAQQMIFDRFAPADVPGTGSDLAGVVLGTAHPNPFRGSTAVSFELPSAGPVRLSLHDASGRTVAVLAQGWMPTGRHAISLKGIDDAGHRIGSGVYFIKLDAEGQTRVNKLVVVE